MGVSSAFSEDYSAPPTWLRRQELLHHAFNYVHLGWRVFPIHRPVVGISGAICACGNPNCKPGKHPCISNFLQRATKHESQISEWWDIWENANIGILTGQDAGKVVLDVDPRNGGDKSLARLIRLHQELPHTAKALSG